LNVGRSRGLFAVRARCYFSVVEQASAPATFAMLPGIRLDHLTLLPVNFLLSFDKFETVRACRLTWRDGDFIGAAFEK
jgi:hypothetical protein